MFKERVIYADPLVKRCMKLCAYLELPQNALVFQNALCHYCIWVVYMLSTIMCTCTQIRNMIVRQSSSYFIYTIHLILFFAVAMPLAHSSHSPCEFMYDTDSTQIWQFALGLQIFVAFCVRAHTKNIYKFINMMEIDESI